MSGRHRGLGWWLVRITLSILGLLLLLMALGALYQAIATAQASHKFPAPGELVDVGGFRLHINCQGQGSPTVVLDAGLGGSSLDWRWVQPEIAEFTRVCAYDRAGFGWSGRGPRPRSARRVSSELHTLLAERGIEGPYVLVAHSWAGFYARYFAHRYPEQVAGLVLIDASHEDNVPTWINGQLQQLNLCRYLAPFGVARIAGIFENRSAKLPPEVRPAYNAHTNQTDYCGSMYAELAAFEITKEQLQTVKSLGNTPLVVLAAPPTNPAIYPSGTSIETIQEEASAWLELQRELADLSSNSTFMVVEGSGHHIHWDAPELVVNTIKDVVGSVREQGSIH